VGARRTSSFLIECKRPKKGQLFKQSESKYPKACGSGRRVLRMQAREITEAENH
jgi:hypothetical protein